MLKVLALIAIAAGMAISVGTVVRPWIAARKQDKVDDRGSTHVEHIDGITKFVARAMCAAFILGTIPTLVEPAAIAQMSANKPHGGVDCAPVGVTKDSNGVVWAEEDCNGGRIRARMSPLAKDK
jgi:hypothetical protein